MPQAPDADPELAFVMAPHQTAASLELVSGLRFEAEAAGIRCSQHIGNFPAPRKDRVYVLVSPEEYFTLLHGRPGPLPEVLARTVFICAEVPNAVSFGDDLTYPSQAGALFDLDRSAVRRWRRRGISAEHLQLGWSSAWSRPSGRDRDIDILFVGPLGGRAERVIGSYAPTLSRFRTQLVLVDGSPRAWPAAERFEGDERRRDLLRRAKVLIHVHPAEEPCFEWLPIVQALGAGVAVISERSFDIEPLVTGEHLISADVRSLDLLAALLVEDFDRRERLRAAAEHLLGEGLTLAPAVERLASVAAALAAQAPLPNRFHVFFTQPQPDTERLPALSAPLSPPAVSGGDPNAAWTRRALKDLRLEMLELRRTLARMELESTRGQPAPLVEHVDSTAAYEWAAPEISLLTAVYNQGALATRAITTAAQSRDCSFELIVVDDGSTDGTSAQVTGWMRDHEHIPALLLRHRVNRGLAQARNSALSAARGTLYFVLDADNEVFPRSLSLLQRALNEDPRAAFAYGMLEKFNGSECLGLVNPLPWEPARLRIGNYIDAMAMIRTSIARDQLGGYPTDRRLYGWEDYALWCAMASAGHRGVLVPEIVARYRVAEHSMLSLTNLSTTDAFAAIIEANPVLMAGVAPPA